MNRTIYDKIVNKKTIFLFIALVHLAYSAFFLSYADVKPLIYNTVMAVAYIVMALAVVKRHPVKCAYFSFCETLCFCFHMTLWFGNQGGFLYYLTGAIPITFYLVYINSEKTEEKKLRLSHILATIIFVTFVVIKILGFTVKSTQYQLNIKQEQLINIFSGTMGMFVLLLFMMLVMSKVYRYEICLKAENKSLYDTANYDSLTGLLNRNTFEKRITEYIDESYGCENSFSLIMADIDDFKKVNDTYGHDAGDMILKNITQIIANNTRPTDSIFRWGGEEIIIIIKSDKPHAALVAERIRQSIEDSITLFNGSSIKVTITMGLTAYKDGDTGEIMRERADKRLYKGKSKGKNCVVYQ